MGKINKGIRRSTYLRVFLLVYTYICPFCDSFLHSSLVLSNRQHNELQKLNRYEKNIRVIREDEEVQDRNFQEALVSKIKDYLLMPDAKHGWGAALNSLNQARTDPSQLPLPPKAFALLICYARQKLEFQTARQLTEQLLAECTPENLFKERTPQDPLDPSLTYLQRAYYLVHIMTTEDTLSPNEDTYRSLLGLCTKSLQWDEALLLFHTAGKQGVAPTKFMYDEVLSALEACNLTDIGEVLYEQGLETGMFPTITFEKGVANLDLHNMTVATATTAVRSVLSDMLQQPTDRPWHDGEKSLMIITGAGRHSEDGIAVIRPAVLDLLNKELNIKADLMRYNPGCIEVTPSQLKQWKEKRLQNSQQ